VTPLPPPTILISDDDPVILGFYSKIFPGVTARDEFDILGESPEGGQPAIACRTFEDPVLLIANYREMVASGNHCPLCILDMRMPTMSGLEAALQIREIDPDIDVIICTAFSDVGVEEIRSKLQRGIFFFRKPFVPEELTLLVHSVVAYWTATREAIRRLEAKAAQLRTLSRAVEQSPAIVVITDTEGRIEYVNARFTATSGYPLEEVVGRNPRILKSGETAPEIYFDLWQTICSGKEWRGVFHNRKKNGDFYWVSATIFPITDEAGRITHFLAEKEDITERMRVDQCRQLGHAISGVLATEENLERGIEQCLAAIARTLDCASGALWEPSRFGNTLERTSAWPPESGAQTRDPVLAARALAESRPIWVRDLGGKGGVAGPGNRFPNAGFGFLVKAGEETLGAMEFVAHWLDIPDPGVERALAAVGSQIGQFIIRKRADMALQETHAVLEMTVLRSNELAIEAQAASRAKSEFLATMSHELRTPLNAVIGFSSLLAETSLDEGQKEFTSSISRSGVHLLSLVDDILDIARIEKGQLPLDPRPLDFHEFLETTCAPVARGAAEKELDFSTSFRQGLPARIVADRRRLGQILSAILGNAVKFTSSGSVSLLVSQAVRPGESSDNIPVLEFVVSDTGIGMAPEVLESLFTPFSQADSSSSRQHEGLGLGLPLARNLAELMGGGISVISSSGAGSTFTFWFPATIPSEPAPTVVAAHPPTSPEGHPPAPLASEKMRILVVEDNETNLRLACLAVRKLGYDCDFAKNGIAALEAIAARKYDAVIMDVQMPEMDGIEATRALRERERETSGHLPVIALTANAMDGDRERCIDAGMDDYLTKPLNRNLLAEKLSALLVSSL